MCGIAGVVGKSDENVTERLIDGLLHRGPDGQSCYSNGPCTFIHTRLAIMDVQGGDQPFVHHHQDGSEVALIGNGEIYNNLNLRNELKNVSFKSESDCEPPLHLYLKYGLDFVDHLRGMYAFAIWDAKLERLILSRDPFGIKPLYYAPTHKGFAFASEPAILIKARLVEKELNTAKRDELLQLQYNTGRNFALGGINRVLPGEMIVVEKGRIVDRRIRSALPTSGPRCIAKQQAISDLDGVLNNTIGVHQYSDVPYGMFLSGGIDSSVLLAMMNRLNAKPVMAFTAGFSNTKVPDERVLARQLAESQGAVHIEIEFGADDFWQDLPKIVQHMDDPVADYAILPTWKLAAKAKAEGIKVVLSGEGGDEIFAGYGRYRMAKRWLLPKEMHRNGILDGLGVLKDNDPTRVWRTEMVQAGLGAMTQERSKLQALQAQDIATWLPCDLLTKLDRMLMAHGVEGRVPFLDPQMADFAFTLPDGLKARHGIGKRILRRWLQTALPQAQPFSKKRGFTVPVGEWIVQQGGVVGQLVASQESIECICKPAAVRELFTSNDGRATKAAWTLLFYALWHKIHIQGTAVEGNVCDMLSA